MPITTKATAISKWQPLHELHRKWNANGLLEMLNLRKLVLETMPGWQPCLAKRLATVDCSNKGWGKKGKSLPPGNPCPFPM